MLFYCWPNVVDGGPTLKQHWVVVDGGQTKGSCVKKPLQQDDSYSVITTILLSEAYL